MKPALVKNLIPLVILSMACIFSSATPPPATLSTFTPTTISSKSTATPAVLIPSATASIPSSTSTPEATAYPGWENYTWGTLSEIISEVRPDVEAHDSGYSLFPIIKRRVILEFKNEFRPLSEEHFDILFNYLNFFTPAGDEDFIDYFRQEALFSEADIQYWIPVEEQLVPFMEQELENGTQITAYIIYVGSNCSLPSDWAFWMTEFDNNLP